MCVCVSTIEVSVPPITYCRCSYFKIYETSTVDIPIPNGIRQGTIRATTTKDIIGTLPHAIAHSTHGKDARMSGSVLAPTIECFNNKSALFDFALFSLLASSCFYH